MKVLLGFDPGGSATFGWAAGEYGGSLPIRVFAHGAASDAHSAVGCALDTVPRTADVIGAGIDSPLCWGPKGGRNADELVRTAVAAAGCPTPGGTVQHVNSLRGACLVQGLLALRELRRRITSIVVSEAHPKALLWLLGVATQTLPVAEIGATALRRPLTIENPAITHHTRDASLSLMSAWAAISRPAGWTDLVEHEMGAFFPCGEVSYLMPVQGPEHAAGP